MKEKQKNYIQLFEELQNSEKMGWILLSESDLKLLDEIREIREIVLEIEEPDFIISSHT